MSQQPEFVRYETADGVGTITLDRPPLNAYDPLLHFELEQAWREGARDPRRARAGAQSHRQALLRGGLLDGSDRDAPPAPNA